MPDTNPAQSVRPPEVTWAAILLGVTLSVVMGAANVYLGLRAGMTVSASIPAAVISIGILRGALRRTSILESNLVQTAASAGESLAAGIIFTMPALILTGAWEEFNFWTTTLVALSGGVLGVLLMIPMREVFVINNDELKFPEGVACAEVLRAGADEGETSDDRGPSGLRSILGGILVGGIFKGLQSFVGLFRSSVEAATMAGGRVIFFGAHVSPALFSVGYIVTLPIAFQIFAGGVLGWLVAIPLLGTEGLTATDPVAIAYQLWSSKVRYLGVGAMIVGGLVSIWKVRHGLVAAAKHVWAIARRVEREESVSVTERNLDGRVILALVVACVLLVAAIYYSLLHAPGLTVLATVLMLVMSFFFSAVASYIVGLVGNSNSPVSGMTITAVLGSGLLIMLFGFTGTNAILATLGVAGVVCCVACTSGDVCNDLKTGQLVGASPRNQQLMQLLGIVPAAFVMAPVMTILHKGSLNAGTGGIGGEELPAPQAGLFAALANGFFGDGELPQSMVLWGIAIGIGITVLDYVLERRSVAVRLHVMPVAVGIYLPVGLSVPILLGGIVRYLVERRDAPGTDARVQQGVLLTSGLIAGESLAGVFLGLLAYLGLTSLNLADKLLAALPFGLPTSMASALSLVVFLGVAFWVYRQSVRLKDEH